MINFSDYEMRVRAARCTLCGAAPQSNCHDERGRVMHPHIARMDAYGRTIAKASEHTLGPWYYNGSWVCTEAGSFSGEYGKHGGSRICTVDGSGDDDSANGPLLAAAPDLLAALAETVADLEAAYDDGEGARPTAVSATIYRANAAIAKAVRS